MVKIDINYTGQLHCEAKHGPSGATLATDAPVDNNGKGEAFSPTDLVATAMGTCMLTVMGIVAEKKGIDLGAATATVEKEMSADLPRRIVKLTLEITVPLPDDHAERKLLESTAKSCPVYNSVDPEMEKVLSFRWTG